MEETLEIAIGTSGPIVVASLLIMGQYLVKNKVYSYWQLRTTLLWPKIAFEYRDHTKVHIGKAGIWYLIFLIGIFILTPAVLLRLLMDILKENRPTIFAVVFGLFIIIPLIAYVAYSFSKEKHH